MYVNAYLVAVPEDDKAEYLRKAKVYAEVALENGALEVYENWELEVPNGAMTDFRKAVLAQPEEKVVVSWTIWPDREFGARGHKAIFSDPRMAELGNFPIDGNRLVMGGFEPLLALRKD